MKTYRKLIEDFTTFDDEKKKPVKFPDNLLRKVAAMTDDNDHSGARILIAKELEKAGNRSGAGYAKQYRSFRNSISKGGGISNSVARSRHNADKAMKQELQRTFSNWKEIWDAL